MQSGKDVFRIQKIVRAKSCIIDVLGAPKYAFQVSLKKLSAIFLHLENFIKFWKEIGWSVLIAKKKDLAKENLKVFLLFDSPVCIPCL